MSENKKNLNITPPETFTGRGGWRGGGRPALPDDVRKKRRDKSRDKYSDGKIKIQTPVTPEINERFKKLKEIMLFKKNEQLLEYLIELGEKEQKGSKM